jgi:hypothetical protein
VDHSFLHRGLKIQMPFKRKEASWRSMLLFSGGGEQKRLRIVEPTDVPGNIYERSGVLGCPDRARVGTLGNFTRSVVDLTTS